MNAAPLSTRHWYENGVLTMVISSFLYSISVLAAKQLTPEFNPFNLIFFRNLIGLAVLIPMLRATQLLTHRQNLSLFDLSRLPLGLLITRSLAGVAGIACNYFAIAHLPMATAITLGHTSPFFVALLAPWILKERFYKHVLLVILMSFVGMVFIVKPVFHVALLPALVGLSAGLCTSIAHVSLRRIDNLSPAAVVTSFYIIGILVTLPLQFMHPVFPSNLEFWGLVLTLAVCGTLSQIFLTLSFQHGAASRVSAMHYFAIPFAALWDLLLWQTRFAWLTVIGGTLIIAGGCVLSLRRPSPHPTISAPPHTPA